MKVVVGGVYRHFKGANIKVIAIAKHSETLENMVVYSHEDTGEIWVRPYDMFIEEVDHEKYPEVEQKYRFEYIGESE
ncbi:MAG: DUF1653 domain-containing protein [Bacilli bacterium]|nr:DUF1653 domain-containing protein [Bacilli bacterium]